MAQTTRTDADILAEIEHIIRMYPPLTNDRPFIHIDVTDRKVTAAGHIRTSITRKYLENALHNLPGVAKVDSKKLFSDDQIRLAVGQKLPAGVNCNVNNGVVILTIPSTVAENKLVKAVQKILGVRAVLTQAE